ncbi:hypothetical protein GUJ93_ZPchr0005g14427 [Zizania palustris]|uniref:Protein kinase domain-containing protein n=1 Tax=Zizania palustris TaxID=103762 RepID=A0A8J5SMI8_ZIZPA|nr:hypothetical protein GUJ93_ZPchr0005g14427 [Zizania palustris]
MEHGSLRSRLYGGGAATAPLSWAQRLEACVGAARGLLYLHTSNILLDNDLTTKVTDFGLFKAGPDIDETHVSMAVRGSFGYIDRRIAEAVRPTALRKYGETVARCLADRGADRATMEDVMWSLQFVMRLQEVNGLDVFDVSSLNMVHERNLQT